MVGNEFTLDIMFDEYFNDFFLIRRKKKQKIKEEKLKRKKKEKKLKAKSITNNAVKIHLQLLREIYFILSI